MRTKFTSILTLIITLVLVNSVTAEVIPEYISVVEIYVDGITDAAGIRTLEAKLMREDGIAEISDNLAEGVIALTLKQDVGWLNLFDLAQLINGTRQYTVRKMDVVAVGRIARFPVDYEQEVYDYGGAPYDGAYDYVKDRHALHVGDNYFLLAKDHMLDGMISSGHEIVRVLGTVKTFSAGVPIMRIKDFQELNNLAELSYPKDAEPVESHAISSEIAQDRISWIRVQVDGMTCAECVRKVESALTGEKGVASVTADLETGTVVIIPKTDGHQIKLVNLISRINGTREFVAGKITVIAEGRVARLPVKYHEADLHIHSHDRYKLQVGNTHFILSDNEKLHELLESEHERIRVAGTVSAFNGRVPIMAMEVLEEAGDTHGSLEYVESLDADKSLPVEEIESVKAGNTSPHIESIKIYVDGFICNRCGRIVYKDLMKEEGIERIVTDTGLGLIEIVPKAGEPFDLHSVRQRINAMREYTVTKIEIVASGQVQAINFVDHTRTFHSRPRAHKRYKLVTGEFSGFILFENDKLKEIVEAGNGTVTVVGTVAAFRGKTPILHIRNYKEIEDLPNS